MWVYGRRVLFDVQNELNLLIVQKVRDKKKAIFYKRCPFCCLLFHSRDSLIVHIPNRHPEQANSTSINVDLLPDAEDVRKCIFFATT